MEQKKITEKAEFVSADKLLEESGKFPAYTGKLDVSVWHNCTKEGKDYLTIQIGGKDGIRINAFPFEKRD